MKNVKHGNADKETVLEKQDHGSTKLNISMQYGAATKMQVGDRTERGLLFLWAKKNEFSQRTFSG